MKFIIKLMPRIRLLAIISLSIMSFSLLGDKTPPLGNKGKESEATIKLKPDGENAKPIQIPLSLVKKSKTLNTMLLDLEEGGPLDPNLEIPLSIDEQTLRAIFKSLEDIQNLEAAKSFTALKNIVKKIFPEPESSKALAKFIKAALYLDLDELLRPSVALLVDYVPWVKATLGDWANPMPNWNLEAKLKEFKERLFKEYPDFPADLFSFVTDYLYPISILKVGAWPLYLIGSGDKLYVLNTSSRTISVINSISNTIIGAPIFVGGFPYIGAQYNNKLYVAVENGGTPTSIRVIDLTTARTIGAPIALNDLPSSLVIHNNKLYVAIESSKDIIVIDLINDQFEDPIQLEEEPYDLNVIGNKLFATTKSTTLVIDPTTRKVTKTIEVGTGGRKRLSMVSDDKLYVNAQSASPNIEVIDSTTEQVVKTIPVSSWIRSFAVYGDRLYYSTDDKEISVIDLTTRKNIGTIKLDFAPVFLSVVNHKLYAIKAADEGTVSVINLYYFE